MSAQNQAVHAHATSDPEHEVSSNHSNASRSVRIRDIQATIALEEDPHRAALDFNPEGVRVFAGTWAAIGVCVILFEHLSV